MIQILFLYYSDTTICSIFFYNSVIEFIVSSCTIENKLIRNIWYIVVYFEILKICREILSYVNFYKQYEKSSMKKIRLDSYSRWYVTLLCNSACLWQIYENIGFIVSAKDWQIFVISCYVMLKIQMFMFISNYNIISFYP